jgi:hypothetical protein
MAGLLGRVWEFAAAVIGFWYVWITAVPFVIDQGLSHRFLPRGLVDWADRWWPPDKRHRVLKWLCAIGFVIATFQAFDEVNSKLRVEQAKFHEAARNRWEPLSDKETLALRSELRKIPSERLSVLCGYAGCADLADSIFSSAHDLNWTGNYEGMYFSDSGIKIGIEIWSYSKKAEARNKIAEAIERATNGRLKINQGAWPEPAPPEQAEAINLVIGRVK